MDLTIRGEDFDVAARDLRALASDLDRPTEALRDIGEEGTEQAAALAPKLTGTTARSIRPVATATSVTITAPHPAGPINYQTNRFMDTTARDLHIKAVDLMEAAITRSIERNLR